MSSEITFLPDGKKIQVPAGTTLLNAARKAKVHVRTRCDGKAACLMCKMHVPLDQQEGIQPAGKNERLKLGSQLAEGTRLSCQARTNGLAPVTATLPEDPLKAAVRKQLERQRQEAEGI